MQVISLEVGKMVQKEYDRCLRCGRKLKSAENRLRGYGKICWQKMKKDNRYVKKLFTFILLCVIMYV